MSGKSLSRWRFFVKRVLIAAIICGAIYLGGMFFAPELLRVESQIGKADAIVVLGGENWKRVPRAAELYLEGNAPVIMVSGHGDCDDNRNRLLKAGVPAQAILQECKSTSTFENAMFSVRLLQERGATNIIVVTSWYHSRRALACFKKAGPGMSFYSVTTSPEAGRSWPNSYERRMIGGEYVKMLGYCFRHGVRPL